MSYEIDKDDIIKVSGTIMEQVNTAFKNKNYVETIVLLHSGLESAMNGLFGLYCALSLEGKEDRGLINADYSLLTIGHILYNLHFLSAEHYESVMFVNKIRNRLVHHVVDRVGNSHSVKLSDLKRAIDEGKLLVDVLTYKFKYGLPKKYRKKR